MRLVFLYGPPAVGKLTVAQELAALTGYKLFHNHLTVDLVAAVFPFNSPAFWPLVRRFRHDMLTAASRDGVDLIFTYVYAHPDDQRNVRALIKPILVNGGAVHFVQLTCAREVLLGRVASEPRRPYRKLVDPAAVSDLLDRKNLVTAVPFAESLQIDTTSISPADAARQILIHYNLPTIASSEERRG